MPPGSGGQCWALPCPAPCGTGVCAAPQQSRPAAGVDRLFSVLQLLPQLSLPHVSGSPWQSFGRSVVGRGILHVPVSEPSSSGPRPSPVVACSCLAVVQCPEFPLRMIPGSAAGPGSPGRRSEVPALLGRDPLSPQVQRHHPDQSLRLLSMYLRVFHGTSPAAGPWGVLRWEQALFWIRSVAASRGEAEQKLRVHCPDGEERRGRPSGLRMN